jgi:hypothetical protein
MNVYTPPEIVASYAVSELSDSASGFSSVFCDNTPVP